MPGSWQATPIVVDGNNNDWPSPYPNYDSKAKIAYATSNDLHYLYITMQTGDELTALKMLKNGMTVSIDTTGKKNTEPFNISFPLATDNSELELSITPDGQKEKAMMLEKQLFSRIRKAMETSNQMTLAGFPGCNGGYMSTQVLPCGIKVKLRFNEYKELIWEAAIPMTLLYGKDLTPADAGKPISVCYAIKAAKAPKNRAVENANGGFNQTPGGGGRNGAMSGGMPQGGRGKVEDPLEHLYTPTKTWKQFSLVVQP